MVKKQKGFTLIEIVITLIIIGVLAALIVTNLESYIEKSHAPEAALTEKSIADGIDACIATGQTAYNCITVQQAGGALGTIFVVSHGFGLAATDFSAASTSPSNFAYSYLAGAADGFPDPSYAIIGILWNPATSTYVETNIYEAGPSLCGSSNTSNTADQYVVLCRDTSGNRSMQGLGYFQGAV